MTLSRRIRLLLEADPAKRLAYLATKFAGVKSEVPVSDPEVQAWVVNEVDPTKGEYSEWILRQLSKLTGGHARRYREDGGKLREDLELFHRNKQGLEPDARDINRHSLESLHAAVQAHKGGLEPSGVDVSAKKLLDTPRWLVVTPLTEEAACRYGAGTRWCTAARNGNMFDHYNDDGPLLIFIRKSDQQKWQWHPATGQCMNSADVPADLQWLYQQPDLTELVWAYAGEKGQSRLQGTMQARLDFARLLNDNPAAAKKAAEGDLYSLLRLARLRPDEANLLGEADGAILRFGTQVTWIVSFEMIRGVGGDERMLSYLSRSVLDNPHDFPYPPYGDGDDGGIPTDWLSHDTVAQVNRALGSDFGMGEVGKRAVLAFPGGKKVWDAIVGGYLHGLDRAYVNTVESLASDYLGVVFHTPSVLVLQGAIRVTYDSVVAMEQALLELSDAFDRSGVRLDQATAIADLFAMAEEPKDWGEAWATADPAEKFYPWHADLYVQDALRKL